MGKDIAPAVRELLKEMTLTELRCVEVILLYDMEKSHTDSPAVRNILADIQEVERARIRTA